MAADSIAGYIDGLMNGVELKRTSYALDRPSRKAALARFLFETNDVPDDLPLAA